MRSFLIAFVFASSILWGQTLPKARVYVDQASPVADAFSAAIEKKHLPVVITTNRADAQYVADFTSASNAGSKARGITTAIMTGVYADGSWTRVSMKVVDVKTSEVVFSYTCGKGGGRLQSAAECLAKHWKSKLDKAR